MRSIDRYSNDWFSGGGGVYPIHITRSIWFPEPPVLPVLLVLLLSSPPVQAIATSAKTRGSASFHVRLIRLPPIRSVTTTPPNG